MKERTPQTKSFTHSYTCFQSVFTPTVALLHHPPEPEELGDRPQAPQEGPHVRLYCFVLSPVISLGAVPHHHLALSVKELTYSSNS